MESIECGVSECDREASIMRRPWPTRGRSIERFANRQKGEFLFFFLIGRRHTPDFLSSRLGGGKEKKIISSTGNRTPILRPSSL
jgi:hypothetical protein